MKYRGNTPVSSISPGYKSTLCEWIIIRK